MTQSELLHNLAKNHIAKLTGAKLIDVWVIDQSTFGVTFRYRGYTETQYVSSSSHTLQTKED